MAKKLTNKERKEIADMVDHMQNCCLEEIRDKAVRAASNKSAMGTPGYEHLTPMGWIMWTVDYLTSQGLLAVNEKAQERGKP